MKRFSRVALSGGLVLALGCQDSPEDLPGFAGLGGEGGGGGTSNPTTGGTSASSGGASGASGESSGTSGASGDASGGSGGSSGSGGSTSGSGGEAGGGATACDPGFFGSSCAPCTCQHGVCKDGVSGDGTCSSCDSGWTSANCSVALLIAPIERTGSACRAGTGTCYVLEFGDWSFEVIADGGRITSYKYLGQEILTDASNDATNWGSTLWTSPQSAWNWPPPAALDTSPYTNIQVGATSVSMTSVATNSTPRVSVTKTFSANLSEGTVDIEYVVTSQQKQAQTLAPWEVTRVYSGGLSYSELGEVYLKTDLGSTSQGGFVWFDYDTHHTAGKKLFADAGISGTRTHAFLAHATSNLLFVKQWLDVPKANQVTGEGEIEIYDGTKYVELENQGPIATLQTQGSTTSYTVRWYMTALPVGSARAVGNSALMEATRALVR
jgi:hypothetical protein